MSIEFSVALLVFLLTVILTVYNHRQASALRGVERLAHTRLIVDSHDAHNGGVVGQGVLQRFNIEHAVGV